MLHPCDTSTGRLGKRRLMSLMSLETGRPCFKKVTKKKREKTRKRKRKKGEFRKK